MLDIDLIKEKTRDILSPENIFYYKSTDSTNTRALEYARSEGNIPAERAIFIADGQTAGRGRRGRSFVSNTDAGIYMTLLYTPKSETDTERITARSAVALRQALLSCAGIETGIKWVNDLYDAVSGKKISGILAEAATDQTGKIRRIAVGMGINVYKNAISEEISDIATSIEEISGKRFPREDIISSVITEFYKETDEEEVLRSYRAASLTTGRAVTVHPHSGKEYDAFAKEILEDYSLLVKTSGGEERRIFSGEVRTKLK